MEARGEQRGMVWQATGRKEQSVRRHFVWRALNTHATRGGLIWEMKNRAIFIPAVRSAPFALVVCFRFEARMLIESCGRDACGTRWYRGTYESIKVAWAAIFQQAETRYPDSEFACAQTADTTQNAPPWRKWGPSNQARSERMQFNAKRREMSNGSPRKTESQTQNRAPSERPFRATCACAGQDAQTLASPTRNASRPRVGLASGGCGARSVRGPRGARARRKAHG